MTARINSSSASASLLLLPTVTAGDAHPHPHRHCQSVMSGHKHERSASIDSAETLVDTHIDDACWKRPRKERRVHFASQDTTFEFSCNMTTATATSSSTSASTSTSSTTDNNSKLWFTAQELHDIRKREAHVIYHHKTCSYYVDQVMALLGDACRTAGGAADGAGAVAGAVSCNNDTSNNYLHHNYLAQSMARGLEGQILSCIRQRRKQVLATFLKSQTSLQHYTTKDGRHFSKEFQQQTLSEHYQKLAQPAKQVARLLALADAKTVST